ncbi:MAG: hypothetical protein ACYTG5_05475 [Planctomycetota bacterium]|jgi:hypothetical protein
MAENTLKQPREKIYDLLMNARQAKWVELDLEDGRSLTGAIIAPFGMYGLNQRGSKEEPAGSLRHVRASSKRLEGRHCEARSHSPTVQNTAGVLAPAAQSHRSECVEDPAP